MNAPPASPRYSIIIPTWNSAATLEKLLDSLQQQTCTDFEVIVVDDASTDATPKLVARYPARYLRQAQNAGPAAARNRGAGESAGVWLVFTDADTQWLPDSLARLDAVLADYPDTDALVGSYAGQPANRGFVPRWKALWEYCMIDLGYLAQPGEAHLMNTWAPRPGAVRRSAFDAVGGFDTRFRGADLEDMEFGYRLHAAGFIIRMAPRVRILHHYPVSARRELRAFARRVVLWMRMMRGRRSFDSTGEGSPRVALGHLLGFAAFGLIPLVLLSPWAALGILAALAAYAALNGVFLRMAWREGGPAFALAALGYTWLHTVILGFAAGYGFLTTRTGNHTDGG